MALGVAAIAWGCGGGGGGGSGGGASTSTGASGGMPLAIDDLCPKLADAYCDRILACGCAGFTKDSCTAEVLKACSDTVLGPTTRADIAAGILQYDAAAAGKLVASVVASKDCSPAFPALGWKVADSLTFAGVLVGTKAVGASCTPISDIAPDANECAGGLCFTLGGPMGTCVGVGGLGAACDDMHLCFDLEAPYDPSAVGNSAQTLRCVVDDPMKPAVAHCQARLADGSMCKTSLDCQSAVCSGGACAPKALVGAMCAASSDCASGRCDPTMKVCVALKAISASCSINAECASTACKSGACVLAICGG